jgi:hypothetical protein
LNISFRDVSPTFVSRDGPTSTAQRLQRARFVGLHEAGISFNIGAKERREPPFYLRRHGDMVAQKLADGAA